MTALLTYFAKMIICSGVLYGYYYLALRNNRFHHWNRYYLLLITLLSLIVPLLQLPSAPVATVPAPAIYAYRYPVINLPVADLNATAATYDIRIWPAVIYGLITLLLIIRIIMGCRKIFRLIRNSQVEHIPPCRFVKSPAVNSPFSFFRYIFWNQQTPMDTPEGQHMFRHEVVHVREKHSMDKLIMELICAAGWLNPFFYLIRRELTLVHEFIADQKAAGGQGAQYAQTILQQALHTSHLSITNNFFHPPIKRRIYMLTRLQHPRFSYLRRCLVIPVTAGILCTLALVQCKSDTINPESTADKNNNSEIFTFVEQPPSFRGGENALLSFLSEHTRYPKEAQEKNISGTVFVQFVVSDKGAITDVRTVGKVKGGGLEEEAKRVVKNMPAWEPGQQNKRPVNVQFNLPIRFSLTDETRPVNDPKQVYTFVDQSPAYPGGDAAINQYLSTNIRYPSEAAANGVQGTVFIRFIVDESGNIRDVETIGAIKGSGLEAEAIRVVENMPAWIPGKQNGQAVAVQFNLPIRFKLAGA